MISAEILKMIGDVLYLPFFKVCRRLFHEGCWPDVWKKHLIVPIYKRGPAFEPGNYRRVHLTTILNWEWNQIRINIWIIQPIKKHARLYSIIIGYGMFIILTDFRYGNQRKGKGTTYDEAINNAIRLCAQSVAKQMVQKLNAKGIK